MGTGGVGGRKRAVVFRWLLHVQKSAGAYQGRDLL